MIHSGKNQAIDTVLEEAQKWDLADKNFKAAIISIFKD